MTRPPLELGGIESPDVRRAFEQIILGWPGGAAAGGGLVVVSALPPTGSLGDQVYLTTDDGIYVYDNGWQHISAGQPGPTGAQGLPGPTGTQGPAGVAGPQGPPGGSTSVLDYSFNATTSEPPVGSQVRIDNVDQTLATKLWPTYTTAPGSDVTNVLRNVKAGMGVYIQDQDDSTRWQAYRVVADAIDKSGYAEVPVAWDSAGPVALREHRVFFSIIFSGKQGPAGPQGPTGAQGPAGATGTIGPQGPQGATGATGTTGAQGAPGATGSQGPKGDTGTTGATGSQGPQGITGSQGIQGPTGTTGPQGPAGVDGKSVRSGAGTPAAGLGVDGDFYINTAANTIYGPKTAGAWGSPTSIVGPQGIQGIQGPQGATGTTGSQGIQGIQGPTGSTGSTGPTGPAGPGVPVGGGTGQVLYKTAGADFATGWQTPTQTVWPGSP